MVGPASAGRVSGRGFSTVSAARTRICEFVVLLEGGVRSGPAVFGEGFLPATYQGTSGRPGANRFSDLSRPQGMQAGERGTCDTLRKMNEAHLNTRAGDSELARA
ncbi:MAG: DUF1501 domain-containing protein [Bryobacteraceae bacterium]